MGRWKGSRRAGAMNLAGHTNRHLNDDDFERRNSIMDMLNIILIVLAVVIGLAYFARRNARKQREMKNKRG